MFQIKKFVKILLIVLINLYQKLKLKNRFLNILYILIIQF